MAAIPTTIGKYRVDRQLGEGGMGTVYLAHDEGIDRHVAIKLLRADNDETRRRFRAEAKAVGKLKHPNIVTVYDYSDFEGSPCIVMEYVEGETVAALIRRGEPLQIQQRLYIIEQVCRGLAYAHRAGIVHRDIKPSNLMVDGEGAIKIVDFGIARTAERGLTGTGRLVGTPAYMSPEQIRGEVVDRRCDIFAIGLVLYELLTGQLAFPGDSDFSVVTRIVSGEPEPFRHPNALLADHINPILEKALAKDPANRFQDADKLADQIALVRKRLGGTTGTDSGTVVRSKDSVLMALPNLKTLPGETADQRTLVATPRPLASDSQMSATFEMRTPALPFATTKVLHRTTPTPVVASVPQSSRNVRGPLLAIGGVVVAIAAGMLWLRNPEPAIAPLPLEPVVETPVDPPVTKPDDASVTKPAGPIVESVPPVPVQTGEGAAKPPVDRALERRPDVAGLAERIAAADRLFEDGDFTEAETAYQAILKDDPRNAAAARGIRAIDQARRAEANLVRGSSRPDTSSIAAQIAVARKHLGEGEYDAAIAAFEGVIKVDPTNAEARAGLTETRKLKAAEEEVMRKLRKPGL